MPSKPGRQNVEQEAADKLLAAKGHDLLMVTVPIVLPTEADLAVFEGTW